VKRAGGQGGGRECRRRGRAYREWRWWCVHKTAGEGGHNSARRSDFSEGGLGGDGSCMHTRRQYQPASVCPLSNSIWLKSNFRYHLLICTMSNLIVTHVQYDFSVVLATICVMLLSMSITDCVFW
jgi:hypothetical protein